MPKFPSFLALRAFEAAARLESFALASEELRQTPSAISHQVRSLETYFAKPLFVRRQRHVELTGDGRRLQIKLASAFAAIQAACAELTPASAAQTLAIHCAPSFAGCWLGPKLPSFMIQHPLIDIKLTASADRPGLQHHAELDLLISYGSPVQGPGLVAEPLGIEIIAALCTPAIAAAPGPDAGAALSHLPLIESAVSPVKWADWLALNSLLPQARRGKPSFDRGALAIAAAVQGVGIALESTRFARQEIERGDLVEFGLGRFQPVRREMHYLCYRKAQADLPKILAFRGWLTALVQLE